jgi:abortive infection bacteriophage resistance protein
MKYPKPALTFDEQHDLLIQRGLTIPDRLRALRWLKHVSYYRLSACFRPFKDGEKFKAGTTFDQIAGLYIFDRKLRLILIDAIERIEVALRTDLTYGISHRFGPFGYVDPGNFAPNFNHAFFMAELCQVEGDSRETFISHYRGKYKSEKHLPFWMASELLSFGSLSRLFKASHPEIKKSFARKLNVPDTLVPSWLHSLSYIRNVCAHHCRLWNREMAVKPALPKVTPAWPYKIPGNDRLYCLLVIIRHILMRIWPQCKWRERLFELFDRHPEIDLSAMQFPENWRTLPPWADSGPPPTMKTHPARPEMAPPAPLASA